MIGEKDQQSSVTVLYCCMEQTYSLFKYMGKMNPWYSQIIGLFLLTVCVCVSVDKYVKCIINYKLTFINGH